MKESVDLISSAEPSNFGALHLKRLWQRAILTRSGQNLPRSENEWMLDKIVLFGLGLALEETFQYLYQHAPAFEEFEKWILEINGGSIEAAQIERINATLRGESYSERLKNELREIETSEPVLSKDDLEFWEENGYVIVREAISKTEARASEEAVWNYLEMNPNDAQSWYKSGKTQGIMIQSFHTEAFRRNRQSKRLRKAFAQIWETADLWTTIDRIGFNPPEKSGVWEFPGPRLHWDMSLEPPLYFGTQGILYLTDVSKEQGAFTCVPFFHRKIEDWLKNLPLGANPRQQGLEALGAKPIAAGAGDFIIWHQALPHGSSPNRARFPRIVQYINMFPNRRDDNDAWK
jgi:hypothetical protein